MKVRIFLSLSCTIIYASSLFGYTATGYATTEQSNQSTGSIRYASSNAIIIPMFDDAIPAIAKGPFENACKIWSDRLPQSLPIRIFVNKANLSGLKSSVSLVRFNPDILNDPLRPTLSCHSPQVKSVLLTEEMLGHHSKYESMLSQDLLDTVDFTITYDSNFLDRASYDMNGKICGKDDFITQALRDIATGLGFYSEIWSDDDEQLNIGTFSPTFFENQILNVIGTDPIEAYLNATQGSVTLNIGGKPINLYAPDLWESASLNYTIPGETKFSQFMSYDIPKDFFVRDLRTWVDVDFTEGLLGWTHEILVGDTDFTNIPTNTVIPYLGQISIGNLNLQSYKSSKTRANSNISKNSNSLIKPYLSYEIANQYNIPMSTFSIMKNDGTWDVVYHDFGQSSNIDLSQITLNSKLEDYYRTYDGHLKAQYTYSYFSQKGARSRYIINYVLSYLPQKAEIAGYAGIAGAEDLQNLQSHFKQRRAPFYDDYYVDVNVAIKNIEGTTRLLVEKWEDGDPVPIEWWEEDLNKGYFTTFVDKEYPTTFRLTAYNDNGHTISEKITLDPSVLNLTRDNISAKVAGDKIQFSTPEGTEMNSSVIFYDIIRLNYDGIDSQQVTENSIKNLLENNTIDLNSLDPGNYLLNYGFSKQENQYIRFSIK